jgi:predicted nicotinamide N-methyase
MKMKWSKFRDEKVDLILASDIIYLEREFENLIDTLE